MQCGSDLPSKRKETFTFWKWACFLGSLGLHLAPGQEMMLCELKGLKHFPSLVELGHLLTIKIKTEWHVIQILPDSLK